MSEAKPEAPLRHRLGLLAFRPLAGLLFGVLGPLRPRGRRRIPRTGGLLVLSNHLSDVDPVAVQYGCPRPVYFMAKHELFDIPILSSLMRLFEAFPVRRGEPDRAALKHAVNLLREGKVVCVFPEGETSESGKLQPVKPGVALIARMAEVPVICCGLRNTNRVMPYGKVYPRMGWHKVTITWGEPKTFPKDASNEEVVAWAQAQLASLTGE